MIIANSSIRKLFGPISLLFGIISFIISPMVPWSGIPLLIDAFFFYTSNLFTLMLFAIVGTILSSIGIIFGIIGIYKERGKGLEMWRSLAIIGLVVSSYSLWLFIQIDFAFIFPMYQ